MKLYDVADLVSNAFFEDPRTAAAFAMIKTPAEGQKFDLNVLIALKRLDWQGLLRIAFKKPLDERQSAEFLDTLEAGGIYNENQQRDIMSFIKTEFPNTIRFIHPNLRNQFLDVANKFPDIKTIKNIRKYENKIQVIYKTKEKAHHKMRFLNSCKRLSNFLLI